LNIQFAQYTTIVSKESLHNDLKMKKIFVCVFINDYIRFSLSEFMLRWMQSYTETLDQKKINKTQRHTHRLQSHQLH